jgi:hypothetical protein
MASRIAGMLVRPRATLALVRTCPRWGDLLLVLTVLAASAAAAVFSTDIGRQALVDQWERTALAFGRPVDDAGYRQLLVWSEYGWVYGAGSAGLNVAGLTLAAAVLAYVVFGRPPQAEFRHVLAVAAHAAVILGVRQVVAAPLVYIRETTASATSLVTWFPLLDETSPPARFLGVLDLFVLWWAIVFAVGVAVVYERPVRKVVGIVIGAYATFALALAAAMAALGETS